MNASGDMSSPPKIKRTPLGGGKLSRKRQAQLAASTRWHSTSSGGKPEGSDSADSVGPTKVTGMKIASGCADSESPQLMAGLQDQQNMPSSTSKRKIDMLREQLGSADVIDEDETKQRCFVELQTLTNLFRTVACAECSTVGDFDVCFGERMGYARQIKVRCLSCPFVVKQYSCTRLDGSDDVNVGFEVNNAMVLCFNELGLGHAAMTKFSALLNIPGMHHKTYHRIAKKVGCANVDVGDSVLNASADAVRDAYAALDHDSDDDSDDDGDDQPLDVMVSFDGTWHKRGFTSNYGVGIVIEVMTGLVLDYEVLSKYCQGCAIADSKNMTNAERQEWWQQHEATCQKNYQGSSKAMEKEAALRMWSRSVDKHKMRYTKMLSDGDSVAHKAVNDADFYGGVQIDKLECLNHCDKRMGTALRKRAKEGKLGGKRRGALTANTCTTLQSYYRNAIANNLGNTDEMRKAIWASLLHCMSTDEEPHHLRCPDGPDSWCFYNRALAAGEAPPSHNDHIHTPISYEVARAIHPVYERMSDPNLLNKMQHGRTQNANEALNGTIWARCPKTIFVGARRVKSAVASAVSHFNQGTAHLSQVMKHMDAAPSLVLEAYQNDRDRKRCQRAEQAAQPETKRQRKQKGQKKKTTQADQEEAEGETYGSGMLGVTGDDG